MIPERALTGRPLAQHFDALLARPHAAAPGAAAAALPGERLARELAARLARLTGGIAPDITYAPAEGVTARALEARVGELAANCLYPAGPAGTPLLVSIAAEAVLRLLDRAFGGRGDAPSPLPRAFPLSSELLIERIEAIVGEALAAALDLAGDAPLGAARRDASLARLAPFAPDTLLEVHEFTVADGAGWTLLLALPAGALAAAAERSRAPARQAGSPGPGAAPFAEVPLTLSAVLVDMAMPLARLATLAVGEILPVAIARSVPVMAGGRRIALGTVGSLDDRVALQLTQAF